MNTTQEAIASLRHSSANVRAEAARYLSENPTADAEPALVAALADSVPEIRNATAYALGQLRQPVAATIKALGERARTDADANVRKSCCYALGWGGNATLSARMALLDVLEHERDIGVRCAAALALERGGYDAGFEFLRQAMRFDDQRTNFEAFTNLGMLGLLPGDWMRDPLHMSLLASPEGRERLLSAAESIRGQRKVEHVSTSDFIDRAAAAGLPFVGISLVWQVDEVGNVKKFDFVLMAPVDAEGVSAEATGVVQHVRDVRFSEGPLARVLGRDDDGSQWFDGPPLVADRAYLDSIARFQQAGGTKTTARARVAEFFDLLKRIDAAGLRFQLLGSGMKPVMAWLEALAPSDD